MTDKEELFKEVYEIVKKQIKRSDKGYDYLSEQLSTKDWNVEVTEDENNPFNLKVKLTLPPFIPAIDEETNELWYICTMKNTDLRYTKKDGKYIFRTNDEFIHFYLEEWKKELLEEGKVE